MIGLEWQQLRGAVSVSDLIPIACSYTNTMSTLPLLSITFRVPKEATGFNAIRPDAMLTDPLSGSYDLAILFNEKAVISLGKMRIWSISASIANGVRTLQLELCSPLLFLTIVDGRGINLLPSAAPAITATLLKQVEAKTNRRGLFADADTSTLPSTIVTPPARDQLCSSILHDIMLQAGTFLFAPENTRGALWRPIAALVDRNPSEVFPFALSDVRAQKNARAPVRIEVQGGLRKIKHQIIDRWANLAPNALATAARTVNAATFAGADGAAEGLAFDVWLNANAQASSVRAIVSRGSEWNGGPVAIGDSFLVDGNPMLIFGIECTERAITFNLISV
jgi:hypothetical protein